MKKAEFQQFIIENISKFLGDLDIEDISIHEIAKNNSLLDGLTIKEKGKDISPTIYLNQWYDKLENVDCNSVLDIIEKIAKIYIEYANDFCFDFDLVNKDFILENVTCQLVSTEYNYAMLQNIVSRNFLDLSVIYKVILSTLQGATFTVNKSLAKILDVTEQELFDSAIANMQKDTYTVQDMLGVIKSIALDDNLDLNIIEDSCPEFLVITNSNKTYGANAILDNNVLKRASDIIGGDFYILPSSIHEILALNTAVSEPLDLKEMVREVNTTQVENQDILSYSIYKYDRQKNRVVTVA